MKELLVEGNTLPEAYHYALCNLYKYGEITECNDWNTTQKEASMTIVVNAPLKEPMISKLFIGGFEDLQQYMMEMLDGILDFEIDRGNWTYTYHNRMVSYPTETNYKIDQVDFIVDELKRNPSSRRAVIMIRDYEDIGSNEPACLQHIQYFIRDNKLHCKVLFRSNDVCKATYMNAFALIMLQKRIADTLGVEMGTYSHRANSFHCYEKDFGMLEGYVRRINRCVSGTEDIDYITYEYEGFWKELMDASIDKINNKVEALKRND